ncbi:MAG TPA: hypothetical protein DDZ53_07240, partial [Firmicutes bacterium]|nr:hypothetical protein [Bacillota bacterium]
FQADQQVSLAKNGTYCFYTYDKYHNFGYQIESVDYIDKEAPSLTVVDHSDASQGTLSLDVTLHDVEGADRCRLYIGFDQDYADLLGIPAAEVEAGQAPEITSLEVPLIDAWQAKTVSQTGIYEVIVTDGDDGERHVTLAGAFRYDPNNSATTIDRTVTLHAVDGSGNRSQDWSVTLSAKNEPTAYVKGELAKDGFMATFSKPVQIIKPSESSLSLAYSPVKTNLLIYQNGSYLIQGTDIFGDSFEREVIVNQFDELYSCTVTVSKTEPTNQNVEVLLNAAFNTKIRLELPRSATGMAVTPVLNGQGEAIGAKIVMSRNGSINFRLIPVDTAFPAIDRTVEIGNIDKSSPTVEVVWSYAAEVVDGKTGGDVTASLLADEELAPLQNTGTTHVFTLDDQTPYVFHYSDLAGNSGSLTATLPVEIVEKTSAEADNTPPDYELSIYQSIGGVSSKVASYSKTAYESLPDKTDAYPLFSGLLQLRFQIFDANQTILSVTDGPEQGVFVSGTTVSVTENCEFTVLLTDAKGNQTEVPVSITNVDSTPPTGTVTYVQTGRYSVRGYLVISDEHEVTLKNTSGVLLETVPGPHYGQYYHDFLDNESFTFIFADVAGNIGTTVAAVTGLDMSEPVGSIKQWVPCYIDADKVPHYGQLAEAPTNGDVSVYIRFDKP